jgi:hypothetical protein
LLIKDFLKRVWKVDYKVMGKSDEPDDSAEREKPLVHSLKAQT